MYFSVCDYNFFYYYHEEIYATGLDILDNLNSVVESIPTHELCRLVKEGAYGIPELENGALPLIYQGLINIFLNYMRKILLDRQGKSYNNNNNNKREEDVEQLNWSLVTVGILYVSG